MAVLLNVLYLFLLITVSPLVAWRSWKHGRYRRGWTVRLFGLSKVPPKSEPWALAAGRNSAESPTFVWLHAVSVGEVQILRNIVETFESQRPDLSLAISVSTDSGMDLATKLFSKHHLFFTPFDFTWSIKKTLRVLQPRLIVLAELELWPNWLLLAEKAGCPVAIINGRLSERSFNGYARIPYLVRKCMQSIDWVGAQSQSYANRFEKLGVPSARLAVTGNIKFDGATGDRFASEVATRKELLGLSEPTALVFIAGSTQAPEESIVLTAFLELVKRFPQLRLILVPRHAQRFEEVANMIAATGLPWLRRTTCKTAVTDPGWRIFLGDTVGELRWWWGLADVGFVGGSFGDRGGQNMIEPCAYGVATCFGPNTRNFSDIVRLLLDEKASEQLQSPEDLQPWLESMLSETTKREQMSTQAMQVCERHRGASERTWANLQRLLPRKASGSLKSTCKLGGTP